MSMLEPIQPNKNDIINYQTKYELWPNQPSLVDGMKSTLFPKKIFFSEAECELSFLIFTREALAEIQIEEEREIELNC